MSSARRKAAMFITAVSVLVACFGCFSGAESPGNVVADPLPPQALNSFDTTNLELVAGFAADISVVRVTEVRIIDAPDLSSSPASGQNERMRPAPKEAYARALVTETLKGEGKSQIDLYFSTESLSYDSTFEKLLEPVEEGREYIVSTRYSKTRFGYVVVPDAGLIEIEDSLNQRYGWTAETVKDRMREAINNAVPFGSDGFPLSTQSSFSSPAGEPSGLGGG